MESTRSQTSTHNAHTHTRRPRTTNTHTVAHTQSHGDYGGEDGGADGPGGGAGGRAGGGAGRSSASRCRGSGTAGCWGRRRAPDGVEAEVLGRQDILKVVAGTTKGVGDTGHSMGPDLRAPAGAHGRGATWSSGRLVRTATALEPARQRQFMDAGRGGRHRGDAGYLRNTLNGPSPTRGGVFRVRREIVYTGQE